MTSPIAPHKRLRVNCLQEACLPCMQIYQANKNVCSHPVFTTYHPLAVAYMLSSWMMHKYLHCLLPSPTPEIHLPSSLLAPHASQKIPSPLSQKSDCCNYLLCSLGCFLSSHLTTGAFKTRRNTGPFPLLFHPSVSNQSVL